MDIIYGIQGLEKLPNSYFTQPVILTMGNFDGMHKGHQHIFEKMQSFKKDLQGTSVVITFKNHPLEVIQPHKNIEIITPVEEKLTLFKSFGIDCVILLDFDTKLQTMDYEKFLKMVKSHTHFSHLVLGEGASFGKNQQGTSLAVADLETKYHFTSLYVKKILIDGEVVSSRRIRQLLAEGDVEKVKELLGRPYSFYAPSHLFRLQEVGSFRLKITYDFHNHCPIASGYYIISLHADERECVAVSYLTTLDCKDLGKTFDLDIYIKGALSSFLTDEVKVEFLKKSPPIDFNQEESPKATILPLLS